MNPALGFPHPPVMRVSISRVKVIKIPSAMVSILLARWEGSWPLRDRPSWRMPKPSRIRPMARIREKSRVWGVVSSICTTAEMIFCFPTRPETKSSAAAK